MPKHLILQNKKKTLSITYYCDENANFFVDIKLNLNCKINYSFKKKC